MEACARIHQHIVVGDGDGDDDVDVDADVISPLVTLAEPLAGIPAALEPEIRRCIAIPGGSVLDDASPAGLCELCVRFGAALSGTR